MKTFIFFALMTCSFASFASEDCSEASTTQEMKDCESKRLTSEDKRLNTQYDLVLKKLAGDDIGIKKLKTAQRAWINFRDADCELVADEMRGGTLEGVVRLGCLADMTKERADRMKDINDFR